MKTGNTTNIVSVTRFVVSVSQERNLFLDLSWLKRLLLFTIAPMKSKFKNNNMIKT